MLAKRNSRHITFQGELLPYPITIMFFLFCSCDVVKMIESISEWLSGSAVFSSSDEDEATVIHESSDVTSPDQPPSTSQPHSYWSPPEQYGRKIYLLTL